MTALNRREDWIPAGDPAAHLPDDQLPRDNSLEGRKLRIVQCLNAEPTQDDPRGIAITDGERTALYVQNRLLTPTELKHSGRPMARDLPPIVPFSIEAGKFEEAKCVAIFASEGIALYLPSRILTAEDYANPLAPPTAI